MKNLLRMGGCAVLGLFALILMGATASAQGTEDGGFPLSANTAYCEPGYLGPFYGCSPWQGVVVTFADANNPDWTRTCETVAYDRTATCVVEVPFGSTIVVSIMPDVIPEGYVLQGVTVVEYEIPDGPPEGLFGGASFVLLPAEDAQPGDNDLASQLVAILVAILADLLGAAA